jgi:hypothetical protein
MTVNIPQIKQVDITNNLLDRGLVCPIKKMLLC